MTRWSLAWALMLLLAGVGIGNTQSRILPNAEQFPIRIRSERNQLLAMRTAPVVYTTLEQFTSELERPLPSRLVPIRLLRDSPPEMVDYVLCVTREGTLIVGEQLHVLDLADDHYVFVRGRIVRAYPQMDSAGSWLWLMDVPLGREASLILELRAMPKWPVESLTITSHRMQTGNP